MPEPLTTPAAPSSEQARIRFYQVGRFAVGNRLLDRSLRTVQSDTGRTNSLDSGHRACHGCGEALGARYALDAAMRAVDGRLVAVNATGCLEVFSTPYPETSWRIAWMHSLFGNAPAVATGVAAAMRVKGRNDVRVVAQAGDGGTVDIGFGCLSGMFERNDDVLFVCYDNEAYMNTGVQRSAATPPAARTATTEAIGPDPGAPFGQGKDLPRLAMAHGIPYVATATVADLHDLEDKVDAGDGHPRGALPPRPRPVPARLGLGAGRHDQDRPPRQGDRALPRVRGGGGEGHQRLPDPPPRARRGVPAPPEPVPRTSSASRDVPTSSRGSRRSPTPTSRATACSTVWRGRQEVRLMERPFAITLDVGSSRANHTGSWRVERPVYVDRLPPCNDACPAGENSKPGSTTPSPATTRRRGAASSRTTRSRRPWGGSATTRARRRATAARSTKRSASTPSSASSATLALERGWELPAPAVPTRDVACSSSAPAPPASPAPTTCAASATRSSWPTPTRRLGGMMRYGIPAYRLPRDVLDAEIGGSCASGSRWSSDTRSAIVDKERREGGFDAVFLARRRPAGQARRHPGGRLRRSSTRWSSCTRVAEDEPPSSSAAASPSTAGATRRWTPPARRGASARPTP